MATARRVSERIRAELARRGMTREQLAAATGISSRTLARRLHPLHPVPLRLDELDDIAAVFGCAPADLLRARPTGETG